MRNISDNFRRELNENRHLLYFADITLADGKVLHLEKKNFMQSDGFKIDDAVSSSDNLDIGSAIVNQLTLKINNSEEQYSDYDFYGASVVAYTGMDLDGKVEKIRMGTFTVDEAQSTGMLVMLQCLDHMRKFDQPYKKSKLSYPATLGEIVRDACSCCDVTLQSVAFDNEKFTVNSRPEDDALTFREVLSWVGQLSVKFCRCDAYGRLVLGWYDQSVLERHRGLDGGIFDRGKPYASGDEADGGNFEPWNMGSEYDGGTFEELKGFHHIHSLFDMSISTDDVVITGVSVEELPKDKDAEAEVYLTGSEGYVISIEKNKFVNYGDGQTVSNYIGKKLIGFRFRKASFRHLSDPTIEAGDVAYLTDRKQNTYSVLISQTTFKAGDSQTTESSAKTPLRNSTERFSEATKNYVNIRNSIKKERTEREKALEELGKRLDNASGTFTTVQKQQDGSNIYYLHNKPMMKESDIIWKMTSEAWGVSTDGGKTWNAGMTVDGDTIVRILQAVGISFDWAYGGTLTLGGRNNGNGVMKVLDAEGGLVASLDNAGLNLLKGLIRGTSISLGGQGGRYGAARVYDDEGELTSMLDSYGIRCFRKGEAVGHIGNASWNKRPEIRGLLFSLDKDADYMCWADENDSDVSKVKLIYYANDKIEEEGLHLGGELYTDNYPIYFGDGVKVDYFTSGALFEAVNGRGLFFGVDDEIYLKIAKNIFTIYNLPSRRIDCYNDIDMHNYDLLNNSDESLKRNIEEMQGSAVEKLKEIGVYSFDWIETGEHEEAGFVARQLETVNENWTSRSGKDGHYSTKGMKLIPYLVKAVQELSEQVEALQEEAAIARTSRNGSKSAVLQEMAESRRSEPAGRKWTPHDYTDEEKRSFTESMTADNRGMKKILPKPIVIEKIGQ